MILITSCFDTEFSGRYIFARKLHFELVSWELLGPCCISIAKAENVFQCWAESVSVSSDLPGVFLLNNDRLGRSFFHCCFFYFFNFLNYSYCSRSTRAIWVKQIGPYECNLYTNACESQQYNHKYLPPHNTSTSLGTVLSTCFCFLSESHYFTVLQSTVTSFQVLFLTVFNFIR